VRWVRCASWGQRGTVTSKKMGGTNLWLTKPAERRPLLKSVGRRSAPAGTAPAVMSRSNIPAKPQVKIKATVHACASFQGSYCKGLARGSGEDARSRRSRIAGQLPAAIEGLAARCGFQKRNKTEKCPARLAGARSRKAPRPGGDRLAQPIRRMNVAGVPVTVG